MPTDPPAAEQTSSSATAGSSAVNTEWQSSAMRAVLFSLLGALIAWVLIEAFLPMIKIPEELTANVMNPPARLVHANELKRAMFTFAVFGGLAALALAAGEGLARKSWKTALFGGLACGVLGVLFGALAGYVGHIEHLQLEQNAEMSDMTRTFIVQGSMLGIIGGAVGMGIGMFLIRRLGATITCLVTGILAAVLAVVAYTLLASFFLPNTITDVVIPIKQHERLLWLGMTTCIVGLLLAAIASPANPKEA